MKIQRRIGMVAVAATALTLAMAGCSAPGSGKSKPTSSGELKTISAPVTPKEVAALGDVTLNVLADQGEQQVMEKFVPAFEKTFPNVKVKIQYKSFNDLTATVLNTMNSKDAPDVTQGNQAWATDGALVKAGLIRPLDDVAKAYGYDTAVGDAITQLQWSPDGKTFGSGTVYGMSPDNQQVGVFYNKAKLQKLGVAAPTSLAELETALAAAKQAGETPLELGNADKASAMQAFSVVQGALTPAKDTRAWITGAKDADFDVPTNKQALETFAGWVSKGYVNSGYDGQTIDDAAAAFSKGDGVFFVGGNWYAGTIKDGKTFGFLPGLKDGGYATSGSFGMPWHIGSGSKATPAAIAFVGMLNSAETAPMFVGVNRVPVHTVEAKADGSIFPELIEASSKQLSASGAMYWYDWSTDTMFDTFTSDLQQVLAGKQSAADMLKDVQGNWAKFHTK